MAAIKHFFWEHHHKFFLILPLIIGVGIYLYTLPVVPGARSELYLTPETATFIGDQEISTSLRISANEPINAIEGRIIFPQETLQVSRISTEHSILQLWIQEATFSNTEGYVDFRGGLPSPGFVGRGGEVITVYFRPIREGEALIRLQEAQVLANDGQGTGILEDARSASYILRFDAPIDPTPDLDGNGTVDIRDLGTFLGNWRKGYDPRFDLNTDGLLSITDLGKLLSRLGKPVE